LAQAVSADRAIALPRTRDDQLDRPSELLARVRQSVGERSGPRVPLTVQRRRGIDLTSHLLLPVVDAERLTGIVVCERRSTRPFDASDLETGLHAVDELAEALALRPRAVHPATLRSQTRPVERTEDGAADAPAAG